MFQLFLFVELCRWIVASFSQLRMLWTNMSWQELTNLTLMLLRLTVSWKHTSRLAEWQVGHRCPDQPHSLIVFFLLWRPPVRCVMVTLCFWCQPNPCSIWFAFVCPLEVRDLWKPFVSGWHGSIKVVDTKISDVNKEPCKTRSSTNQNTRAMDAQCGPLHVLHRRQATDWRFNGGGGTRKRFGENVGNLQRAWETRP